jgi:LysR family glycine cleavage system transcriptional activator
MSRLPLTSLRVFEACARHGSFLKAADELAITPGAVSRQIKSLEAELEVRLFDRFNRAVRLTPAGTQLAAGVGQGLSTLQASVDAVRSRRDAPLVITVIHSMAARWLVPRLFDFNRRYPEVQTLIAASDVAADLARDNIDVAIRLGRGPYPGLHVTHLLDTVMFPVCSPRLVEEYGPFRHADDLAGVPLLHDVRMGLGEPGWPEWLAAAGATRVKTDLGPRFSNTYLAIEAALAGRGVAFAQQAMVIDDLASGRLVRPFDLSLPSPFGQWILSLPEKADQPNIRRFRAWLLEKAAADGLPRSS